MQEQLDLLKSISDNKQLRKEFESFLKEISDEVRVQSKNDSLPYTAKEKLYKNISQRLDDKIDELSSCYDVKRKALMLFFSLDKRAHYNLHYTIVSNNFTSLELKGSEFGKKNGHKLTGSKFEDLYGWNKADKVIKFLEENIDFLPSSSKKYIKSKMVVETEDWNAEKIVNEFQKKVFMRELADKPEPARLRALIKDFNNLDDDGDALLSFHYFYSAVNEKYSGKNERGSKMVKDEIMNHYFDLLWQEVDYCDENDPIRSNKALNTIKTSYSKDSSTLAKVVERALKEEEEYALMFFLYNCDNSYLKPLRDKVIDSLYENNEDSFDPRKFSEGLKDMLFLEIEEQYRETGNIALDY